MSLLDDLVPEPLQSWDTALLKRLRTEGKGETLFFEFKEGLDCAVVEKTVCALANALGGYLLVGVTAKPSDNTIDLYPGLPSGTDWIRRVTDCVVGHISPLPAWDTVQLGSPDVSSSLVVVTRVEPSASTPHLLTRNGRIYVRTPGGSDPVRDKATLDSLVSRGAGGIGVAQRRADAIHTTSGGSEFVQPRADEYSIQIVAIPTPPLGEAALAALLTPAGRSTSHDVFGHRAVRGMRMVGHREDRVHLVGGEQTSTRFTDGSVFVRFASTGAYLGVDPLGEMIEGTLAAAAEQRPPAHQVLVDVRVVNAADRHLDEDGSGRLFVAVKSQPLGVDLWQWRVVTDTDEAARRHTATAFRRRLWRAVGDDRGLEPD